MMHALAAFIMKGRTQALLVMLACAALALVLPPLSMLSVAALTLVTLRRGLAEGLMLTALAAAALLLATYFAGLLQAGLVYAVLLWSPALVLATVLRRSQSLPLTLLVAAGLSAVGIVAFYMAVTDPVVWWRELLEQLFSPVFGDADLSIEQRELLQASLEAAPGRMTGLMGALWMVNSLLCLLVARYWQAMLYNPGGFRAEFHGLRLGYAVAFVTVLIGVMALLPAGVLSQIAGDVALVLLALFALQGLAVCHAAVAARGLRVAWLAALYVLLFFALWQTSVVLALTGFADTWLNIRKRVTAGDAAK